MQSSAEKMLTIVVPAYNVEKYIAQCLESLVRQTCDRFCVIVVNDGSTDAGTDRICREYASRYPELISYISQENKGVSAARNNGFAQVKTPYVSFLDSDDWMDVRFVEYVVRELEKYDDDSIDIVFTLPTVYDNVTTQMYDWMDKELFDSIFTPESPVIDMVTDERPFWLEPNMCRRVMRTEFLRGFNFSFPEGIRWEDVPPHFYVLAHAKRCLGIREVGFFYRTNVPTAVTSTGGRTRLDIIPVFDSTLKFLFNGEYSTGVVNSGLMMFVKFAIWSIGVSQQAVRRELVEKLHKQFRSLPKHRVKAFLRQKGLLNKEQLLFVYVIRSRCFHRLLNDYQPISAARIMMGKLKAVIRKFKH